MTTHRPALLSGTLSALAAAAAVWLVAEAGPQRFALYVTLAALVPVALGLELSRRGHSVPGFALALLGLAGVGGGLVLGATTTRSFSHVVELLPGLVAVTLVVLALGPVRKGSERTLLALGAGTLLVTLVVSAAVYEVDTTGLLMSGVATVLALDLGEQAVNVGEQVGREPKTRGIELLHGGATLAVGGVAVILTFLIVEVDVTGVPLSLLAGLLIAGFTLAIALYN